MNLATRISNVFILSLCLLGLNVNAQKTEIGGLLGMSYYWGDIVNTWQPGTLKPGGTFFVRYHLDPRLAVRGNFTYTKLGGDDINSPDSKWQKNRNLSFRTDIIELSGVIEFNLLPDKNKGRRLTTRFVPYVYGGLGAFYFNPKATNPITGKEMVLRNLKLDGGSYSPVALCIPLGLGFRTYISRNWQIGLELGMRYSASSHIDDVAGNSKYAKPNELTSEDARIMYNPSPSRIAQIIAQNNSKIWTSAGKQRGKNGLISDVYFVGGVTLSYRIWPRGARSYGGRAIRCPRFY